MGMAALFFVAMGNAPNPALWGMSIPWQIAALAAAAVGTIIVIAALLSIVKVLRLEPATVFK